MINFLLPSVSGVLFYLSFHPANLGPLAWGALIPLILHALREPSGKRVFFASWLAGAVFFVPALLWLRHTAAFGPIGVGVYLGLSWALFALVIRRLCLGARWPLAVAAPVAWVTLEYVRSHLFGGFPWLLAGYSQHEAIAVIQIADLGGVWLVSFLVLFVNGAAAHALMRPVNHRRWSAAALASVLVAIGYGAIRLGSIEGAPGPRIGIVQPNIPQDVKNIGRINPQATREIFDKHVRLTRELVERHPDIAFVAWPESVLQTGIFYERRSKEWLDEGRLVSLREAVKSIQRPLLAGVLIGELELPKIDPVDQTNSALLIDPDGSVRARYDKIRLVQFTEVMPFEPVLPVKRIVASVLKVSKVYEFRRGTEPVTFEAGGRTFGVCICSENSYPDISRNLAGKGATAIVNISNEAWFRDSSELDLMYAMAKFRAVENRVPVIRATNSGISAVIDAGGRPVRRIEDPEGRRKSVEGSMAVEAPAGFGPSPYGRLGDAVAAAAAGAALAGLAWGAFVAKR